MDTTTAAHPAAGSRRDFTRHGTGSSARRPHVRAGHQPGRGRPPAGHLPPKRPPLVRQVATRRPRGTARRRPRRPQAQTGRPHAPQARAHPAARRARQRVRQRPVDLQARGDRDRTPHRGAPPPSHAWRILRAMGWTLQRPERRAAERDEDAIARWVKQDWPRIRQTRPAARGVAGVLG